MEKVKYNRFEYRNEYLQSEEWKKLRQLVLDAGCDCQCCGSSANDVHHMVYRNIVDIKITDLIPVCRNCHNLIHEAISDEWISQNPDNLEDIKLKTLNIIKNDEYKEYHSWIIQKHNLSDTEIYRIKWLQPFVIKKISGLIKKNIWYDDLPDVKFTGKQILKIRKIINLSLIRRKNKVDTIRATKQGFTLSNTSREKYKPN